MLFEDDAWFAQANDEILLETERKEKQIWGSCQQTSNKKHVNALLSTTSPHTHSLNKHSLDKMEIRCVCKLQTHNNIFKADG